MKTEPENQEFEHLVAQLKSQRPTTQPAPAAFRANLRTRLLQYYTTSAKQSTRRWIYATVLTALAILTLAIVLLQSPLGVQPVSAADLLQQANLVLTAQASGAALIYDQMRLDIQSALVSQENAVVELWRSPDGQQYRYQLTAVDGSLLYFVQRQGDQVWRSFHNLPIGAEPVNQIYQMTLDQYRQTDLPASVERENLGEVTFGLFDLDQQAGQTCTDLFCLLGVSGKEWRCDAEQCTLYTDGKPTAKAMLRDDEHLVDGRTVHVIELETRLGSGWKRIVKIEAESLNLVEVLDYDRGKLFDRIQWIERRALDVGDIPADFLTTFPAGIEPVIFQPQIEQPQGGAFDRTWIISISPEPGTAISAQTEFVVEIGYELATVPQASLQVMLWPAFDWFGGPTEGSEMIDVANGQGSMAVRFSVSPETLEPGQWLLRTSLGTFDGNQLIFLTETNWAEYQWCIRCNENSTP